MVKFFTSNFRMIVLNRGKNPHEFIRRDKVEKNVLN